MPDTGPDTTPDAPVGHRWLPIATGRAVARRLHRMLRGHRLRMTVILLLFAAEAATALVFPLVTGSLVDSVIAAGAGGVPDGLWWRLALLGVAALAAGTLAWAGTILLARLAEGVIAELRETYVEAALGLPRATIEEAGIGDVVTRASDDIAEISGTLPEVVPRMAVSVLTVALAGAAMVTLDPWFLGGFALTFSLHALTARWYLRTAPAVYAAERRAQSVRGQDILGTLTQLPTVAAHRLGRRQLGRIRSATWETVRWAMRTRIVQNRLFGRLNLTEAVGLLTVLATGIWLAWTGAATPGAITAAALLFLATVGPLEGLLFVMDDLQSALASLGRVVGVIDADPGQVAGADVGGAEDEAEQRGGTGGRRDAVALTGVHFGYRDDSEVLHGVTTSIGAGEVVAVVGATGSGKSTLAALVAGVHAPGAGRITRGVPTHRVMTATQEVHVFSGTLRDNLTLVAPTADDRRLIEVLEAVGGSQALHALPEGLDTVVGHGGAPLGPAQAQLVALARLLLADPALVILDEATAETDTADGGLLDRAASVVVRDRAALVIAHRLSQAASADRVVVLEGGRIIEAGTPTELLALGGAYARLWRAWTSGRGASGPGDASGRGARHSPS